MKVIFQEVHQVFHYIQRVTTLLVFVIGIDSLVHSLSGSFGYSTRLIALRKAPTNRQNFSLVVCLRCDRVSVPNKLAR